MTVASPTGQQRFSAVIRTGLAPSAVGLLPAVNSPILLAEHVSAPLAQALTRAGWNYIDQHANAHVSAPGLVVRIEGRGPARAAKVSISAPFTKAGLPVTFALLVLHGQGVKATQRELADYAETSLATTSEAAAAEVGLSIRPITVLVYADTAGRNQIIQAGRLRRDMEGGSRFGSGSGVPGCSGTRRWSRPSWSAQTHRPWRIHA